MTGLLNGVKGSNQINDDERRYDLVGRGRSNWFLRSEKTYGCLRSMHCVWVRMNIDAKTEENVFRRNKSKSQSSDDTGGCRLADGDESSRPSTDKAFKEAQMFSTNRAIRKLFQQRRERCTLQHGHEHVRVDEVRRAQRGRLHDQDPRSEVLVDQGLGVRVRTPVGLEAAVRPHVFGRLACKNILSL